MSQTLPKSPFTPNRLAAQLRLADVSWDSDGQTLVWLEGRSDQGVLVARRLAEAAGRDLTTDLSVRAHVGYGGGDFGLGQGAAYFSSGGRLYRQPLAEGTAQAITPAFGDFASPTLSPDGRFVAFIHSYERRDVVGVVDAHGKGWPRQLASGEDFYMQPAWHPSGDRLAFVSWNHPHMPWNGTWLKVARLEQGSDGWPHSVETLTLAGGDEAIIQPVFSPDGQSLLYASDAQGGFWNLYLLDLRSGQSRAQSRALTSESGAELGGPAWAQGIHLHAFTPDGRAVVYVRNDHGVKGLYRLDLEGGSAAPLPGSEAYTDVGQVAVSSGGIAAIASSSTTPPRVVLWRANTSAAGPETIRRAASESIPASAHVVPEPVRYEGEDRAEVHGILYRPAVPLGARPPAILHVHGGPTGQRGVGYNADLQFFASRGYVVLDVNYRGSAGYGRAYRDALLDSWGIYDLADTAAGGRFLADAGLADPKRLVVMGGSAGGYTVLRALTERPGAFRAGICLFGVSNLFTLAAETHKFEERYLDTIVGPLPETAARYRERSPIFHADRIVDPIAVFQGADDPVVPQNQADTIVESLRRRNVPHIYEVYPGEGHGWRRADTIERFWGSVEAFLRQYVEYA
jgi:dipeptidyl aminopeptidase/acylaminoacyl peptidase